MSEKKKKVEYFTDKYGIKTVKTPLSENDLALIKKIQDSLQSKVCKHEKTHVAVRHVSGIRLVKCSDCGQTL